MNKVHRNDTTEIKVQLLWVVTLQDFARRSKVKITLYKKHSKETVSQKHKPRQLSIECPMILGFQNHLYNTKKKNRTKGKYC